VWAIVLVASFLGSGGAAAAGSDWARYKALFVTNEGRIVDTGNGGVSHSEGQGWGLLLAEADGDRAGFERIWAWTREHLGVRADRLHAWRWHPDRADDPTPDLNNASDGDIYIAWALLRASTRWSVPEWRAAAAGILGDLQACCVRRQGGHTVLLPGAAGFTRDGGVVINPSYWVFPAFDAFQTAFDAPVWGALSRSGRDVLRAGRFGRWNLPGDWLLLHADGGLTLADGFPSRFSWDAIRVPLLLAWGEIGAPDLYDPFAAYAQSFAAYPYQPAFTNLDDDSLASFALDPGGRACLALARLMSADLAGAALPQIDLPPPASEHSYYTASLLALARLARRELGL
jgi:endoglucanase